MAGNPVSFPSRPYNLRMVVWLIGQSVAGNYSTLGWELWIDERAGGAAFSGGKAHRNMAIDGSFVHESYGNGFDFRTGTNFLLGSGSVNVGHNTDGTKSVYAIANADYDLLGATTADASYPLPTIPRASTVSIAPPYTRDIGTSIALNTNRASSGFTHTLEYTFAGSAYIPIATGVADTVNWTPPLSLINSVPNATSAGVWIRTTTYSGATYIGQTTSAFTLAVPASYVPDFTTILNTEATGGVAANVGKYVQGISTLALEITGEVGTTGSTITARKIEVMSGSTILQTINADSGTTAPITASGTITLRGTVTDSRGRTATKSVNITVLAYQPPVLTTVNVQRSLSDGTVDIDDGTYLRVNMIVSASSLMNTTERNSLNYRISTREYGDVAWTLEDTDDFPGILFNGYINVGTFSVTQAYDVLIEVFDDFLTSAVIISIPVAAVFMHWAGSDGVGFGKYWERGRLDVAGDIYTTGFVITDRLPSMGTAAERDSIFGVPGSTATRVALANRRVRWLNVDTGITESFFAVTGSSGLTVPGVASGLSAGWYPENVLRATPQGRIPSSLAVGGGSAAVAADGTITFTSVATALSINDVFAGVNANDFDSYRFVGSIYCSADPGGAFYMRMRSGGADVSTGYFQQAMYSISTSWASAGVTGSVANNVSAWYIGFRQYTSFDYVIRNMASASRAKEVLGHFGNLGTNEINVSNMGWTSLGAAARTGLTIFPNAAVTFSGWLKIIKET